MTTGKSGEDGSVKEMDRQDYDDGPPLISLIAQGIEAYHLISSKSTQSFHFKGARAELP